MRLRVAMAVAGIVAFAAAAAGIGVRASYGARLTGDEPQYLITAISLVEDRDIDVSDEIAGEAYLPFHEVGLDRQTRPLSNGREVSPHDPLLPALLAVPVALGGWIGAKLALAAAGGALAALLVWIAVVRFGATEARAGVVVTVLAVSAPVAVYGQQVYPEIPAALAVAVAIACLTGRLGGAGLAGVTAGVVALPWLSVKYVPVALTLALLCLWSLWRQRRVRAAAVLVGAWIAAGGAFALAHLLWYGGLTPYAVGDHFVASGELGIVGFAPNYLGRSVRLIGLMVDDKFGLAAWQPAWLLTIPAFAALARVRPLGWGVLAAPLAAGWLTATFVALTMQGWWWPGRQVVVVLPCAVVALAWWASRSRILTLAVSAAAAVGIFSYAWLVAEGTSGRLTWVVDFYRTSNPLYRAWSGALPDYVDPNGLTWPLHALWVGAAAALGAWGWVSSRSRTGSTSRSPTWSMIPSRSRT